MDARVGTEIAGFRIESVLARGGMGVVYIAEQSSPKRKVALKLLAPELASDLAFRQRFVHESDAAASAEHPNIVPIYAAGEAGGQLYIAMRYVEGTDLRALIDQEGALPLDRVVGIVSQVAAALDAAHLRGLVHRDVKPGNVLLAEGSVGPDVAYLCDFGLIRRTEVRTGVTKTGQFMGSVDYCAPEQVRGEKVDGRGDVYSLGCVAYECLTGEPPFRRDTEVATLYAHLNELPPAPSSRRPELPAAWDSVVSRAMAKDPRERYQAAGEFAAATRSAAGGVTAGRAVPARRRRRTPWIAALVGLALIAVVIGVVVATRGGGTKRQEAAPPGPPPNSLVEIDADSGDVLQTVPRLPLLQSYVEGLKPQVAVGEGGVWVLTGPSVIDVDLGSGAINGVIDLPLGSPGYGTGIAVASRTVWVGTGVGLARVNPATGEQLKPVRPNALPVATTGVSNGEGSVWATTLGNQLVQVEPTTAEVLKVLTLEASTDDVAAGEGGVWVLDKLQSRVLHVDPLSGRVVAEIPLGGDVLRIASSGGSVWVLDTAAGVLIPIDPDTDTPRAPIRVGDAPTDLAVAETAVWVSDRTGALFRVDALNGRVTRFTVGAPIHAIAVDRETGHVWAVI
jgi:streptogramin lyase